MASEGCKGSSKKFNKSNMAALENVNSDSCLIFSLNLDIDLKIFDKSDLAEWLNSEACLGDFFRLWEVSQTFSKKKLKFGKRFIHQNNALETLNIIGFLDVSLMTLKMFRQGCKLTQFLTNISFSYFCSCLVNFRKPATLWKSTTVATLIMLIMLIRVAITESN